MKKNVVKKIFLFFLFFLPIQYAMVGIIGFYASEPWPAFILPAFQEIDSTPNYVFVDKPEFSVTDSMGNVHQNITPGKLFNGLQQSQLQGFLRTHFSDSLYWVTKDNTSRAWLLHQINHNYPSLRPQMLNMKWVRTYFNYSTSQELIDSTRIIQEFSVHFNNETI